MKLRISLLFALVLTLSSCFSESSAGTGYRFTVKVEKGRSVTTDCTHVVAFEEYLVQLNENLKKSNAICRHINDMTTMSKGIQCEYVNGPIISLVYWAETQKECERILRTLKTGKAQ